MSAGWPNRWTGMMAFVRGVIGALERGGIHRVVVRIDVDEYWRRTGILNRGDGRDERERNGNHLVAGADAGGDQCHVQCARPRVHGHCFPGAAVGGELTLECLDGRAEHELRALEYATHRGVDLGLERPVLHLQIDKRNHRGAFSRTSTRPLLPQSMRASRSGRERQPSRRTSAAACPCSAA